MSTENKVPVKKEGKLIDQVTEQIQLLQSAGDIVLPKNYSPENALKSAWLKLQDVKDKSGRPVLDVCTKPSIANALMKMVTQGMNPIKEQCYFMAMGDQLVYMRSYHGSVALAKRVAGVKDVNAHIIYKNDKYETSIDIKGVKNLVEHKSPFENRDNNNIIGAYAILEFTDGSTKLEEMTFAEIKRAWAMGHGGGNTKAHQNFPDEMSKKTVKGRACKSEINTSSDSDLFDDDEQKVSDHISFPSIPKSANKEAMTFDDHEEVKEEPKAIENNAPAPIQPTKEKVLEKASANGSLFETSPADPF